MQSDLDLGRRERLFLRLGLPEPERLWVLLGPTPDSRLERAAPVSLHVRRGPQPVWAVAWHVTLAARSEIEDCECTDRREPHQR